jgi:hypothetical protein
MDQFSRDRSTTGRIVVIDLDATSDGALKRLEAIFGNRKDWPILYWTGVEWTEDESEYASADTPPVRERP